MNFLARLLVIPFIFVFITACGGSDTPPAPAPIITSFITSAATITAGSSVDLTAVFANGTASIDNSVGAMTSGVAKSVSPASTTTYTLTVTNTEGTAVTSTVTVTVVPAPTITSFITSAATITAGSSVNLTAVFANGAASISDNVGSVMSDVAKSVSPTSTLTYTLTVTNAAGTVVTSTVTVTVVPAPTITSFITSAATIYEGSSANLTAVFANGTASISDSVGDVVSDVAKSVLPTSTTTYTLTVTNAAGTVVTSTMTVTVVPILLTVSTVDVKTVQFNWNAYTNATSYKLYVNPDNASGFTLQTDNISGTSTTLTLPVHFTDWVNATYMVEAYNSTTLLESSPAIGITSEMLNTIGYVKASNPGENDTFGGSVSISPDGNTLAVGAPYEEGSATGINGTQNDLFSGAGAVYVFTRSGSTWSQQAYVKASNPSIGDAFGYSVSLSSDGNTLAVGAIYEDGSSAGINGTQNDSLLNAGAVYVFTRSGATWNQQAYVKASIPTASKIFGSSISLSSDANTLAVGCSGAVCVFTRSGSTWTQQANIIASNPAASDGFGGSMSVSSDGNTLVVSAAREDGSSAGINGSQNDILTDAGAVYVFTRNVTTSTWSQQAYVKASNPVGGEYFGFQVSVSSDGNTFAVGTGTQAIYIFTRSGSTWSQQAYIKASNPSEGDSFGRRVSISSDGNTLAVGSHNEDGISPGINGSQNDSLGNAGAVYVYTRSDTTWTQQAYVKASNPDNSDWFGYSVSISSDGNTLVVGSRYESGSSLGINGSQNNSLSGAGAVYIY